VSPCHNVADQSVGISDGRPTSGGRVGIDERWDAEGISALKEMYMPLRRFAAVIGRWHVDPDDLVQDAYTKVLMKHPSQIRDLGPYMRRTIVNLATDQRRRTARGVAAATGQNGGSGR
jgi:DNA-directed RNA polymerase specialized sigma24 family protein